MGLTDLRRASTRQSKAILALLTLLSASLLLGNPKAQSPAYGLVEAGFVDGLNFSSGWPQVFVVDPATGRPVIGALDGRAFDPLGRRVFVGGLGVCDAPHYKDAIAAYDIDTAGGDRAATLWKQLVPCPSDLAFSSRKSELRALYLGNRIDRYDPQNGNFLGSVTLDTGKTSWWTHAFDDRKDELYLVEVPFWPPREPPPPPAPRSVVKLDPSSGARLAENQASLAVPRGALFSPATNRLYVLDEQPGRVVAIDGTTLSEVASVDIAPYIGHRGRAVGTPFAINEEKGRLYLLRMEPQADGMSFVGGTAYLVSIDTETMTVLEEKQVVNTSYHQSLAVDPRTGKIYVDAGTAENPVRVQVFSDSSPETLIGDLQTGRYTEWFFAEGTTRPGYRMWLTLFSPDQPNKVRISFLTAPGQPGPFVKEVELPANTRINVLVNQEIGEGLDVSTRIVSVWGKPFYAERPIYYSGGEAFSQGGSLGAGQHN